MPTICNKNLLLVIISFTLFTLLQGQNTVGLLSYVPDKTYDGYNLIYPHNQPTVYLLDNCGALVHQWDDDDNWRPGNTAYITKDGLLYKSKRNSVVTTDAIWAGGGGAILEIRDWDNNLIWDFEMNDSIYRLHHDFSITPDGTIIALAWELKTTEECLAAGRDTSTLAQKVLWPDWIFEIDPSTDEIIWEWHAWDHLIQDIDSSKANYGVIAENPERININYGRADGHPDWMHGNALDYNSDLDQIMLSVPYFDEVWIIDHTTTTAEAATSFGGFSNDGGDLMYRWGNPMTYNSGDSTNQKFFFQHDAHWVDDFLEPTHPQYGKIAVFNNRFGEDYSVASIITPKWNMYEWNYTLDDGKFLPNDYDYNIEHPDRTALWSTGLSSIQILPNGNNLITSGRFGYSFELTPNDEIVWEYVTPRKGPLAATQGDTLTVNQNLTFRMQRYPANFDGFRDKDLSPKGWIELSPDTVFCDQILPTVELMEESTFKVFPNPCSEMLTIEWSGIMKADIELIDIMGRTIISEHQISGGRKYLDLTGLEEGIYFISLNRQHSKRVIIAK